MKTLPCIKNLRQQRGDFLIESLIGVLLIGIVGVGIGMTAKKVNTAQVMTQAQGLAISNLSGAAKGGDLNAICTGSGTSDLAGFTLDADKSTCNAETITLSINGKDVSMPKPIIMEAKKSVPSPNDGEPPIDIVIRVGQ